jgi:hypothetical protein
MVVICAWCELQGRPAMLGEKEPRDTPVISHGICNEHALLVRAEARRSTERVSVIDGGAATSRRPAPSSQRPPVQGRSRLLLIVSRSAPDRLTYLKHMYGSDTVEVIADRRVGQRRQGRAMTTIERRSADRRRRCVSEDMQTHGWTLIRH